MFRYILDIEEHLQWLLAVLKRLDECGLKANRERCKFLRSFVEHLGHVPSSKGLHQSPNKVKAIGEMPKPQDVTRLCAFLDMVQYYYKFLPDLATHQAPLHRLLQKEAKWSLEAEEDASFNKVKEICFKIKFWYIMILICLWYWLLIAPHMALVQSCHTALPMDKRTKRAHFVRILHVVRHRGTHR